MSVLLILEKLNKMQLKHTQDTTKLELLQKQKEEKKLELTKIESEYSDLVIMKELLEKSSDEARKNGKDALSQATSHSLQLVMGDNIRVDMNLKNRAGVPVADLEIITEYGTVENRIDPHDEGGGVRDLVSLSTFMATGFLVGDDNKAPYFLDEPTKFVSKKFHQPAAHAIKETVEFSGRQAFVITHEKEYLPALADMAYEIEQDVNGISKVFRLS